MKKQIIRELSAWLDAPEYQVARWSVGMVEYFLDSPHALRRLTSGSPLAQCEALLEARQHQGPSR